VFVADIQPLDYFNHKKVENNFARIDFFTIFAPLNHEL